MKRKAILTIIILLIFCATIVIVNGHVTEVGLKSPINKTWLNSNTSSFSCNATSTGETGVQNITLIIWNQTAQWVNFSSADYGYSNGSTNGTLSVNFTLVNLTQIHGAYNYTWNCLATLNNGTGNFSAENLSFGVDLTNPNVTTISPDDGIYDISESIDFYYVVSDLVGEAGQVNNCSLIIADQIVETTSDAGIDALLNFSNVRPVTGVGLQWYVKCYDKSGRYGNTAVRSISTGNSDEGSSDATSSGGSTTSSVPNVLTGFTEIETMRKGKFWSFSSGGDHTATVDSINYAEMTVDVTVASSPVTKTIPKGSYAMFDPNGDGFEELKVSVLDIPNAAIANLEFKSVEKPITTTPTTEEDTTAPEPTGKATTTPEKAPKMPSYVLWIIVVAIVIIGVIVYIVSKKKK